MSGESVRFPAPGSKYAIEREPNHGRVARAFSRACGGYTSVVSRLTGISARVLQHYGEPQSDKESPFERAGRLLRALREAGAPEWIAPLRVLADDCDHDLVARGDNRGCARERIVERCGSAMEKVGATIAETLAAARDGEVTDDELQASERCIDQSVEDLHRLRRELQAANAATNARRVRRIAR